MFERLSPASRRIVTLAQGEVGTLGHSAIAAHHILLGVMAVDNDNVSAALSSRGVTLASARSFLNSILPAQRASTEIRFEFTSSARLTIRKALAASVSAGSPTIEPIHLMIGALRSEDEGIIALLENFNIDVTELLGVAAGKEDAADPSLEYEEEDEDAHTSKDVPKNLARFGLDLVEAAREGLLDPVSGRDSEIERMVTILCRRTKNNPVLVGEAGVGKTAVVEGLAQRIASGDVPSVLKDVSLWSLDMASIVGGTQYRGDFEERLKAIVKELQESGSIAFIDEIHSLVGAGNTKGSSSSSAADILKPALSRGELTVIGATTLTEYVHIEKDPALERRFAPVTINAPSVDETIEILRTLRLAYETHHQVTITDDALEAAAKLSDIHIPDRSLPDKAIDVLDEAGAAAALARLRLPTAHSDLYESRASLQAERKAALESEDFATARALASQELSLSAEIIAAGPDIANITAVDIARVVSEITGVSVSLVSSDEASRLLHLEDILSKRVVGQADAKSAVAKGVRRRRSGIAARRPDSYIFAGPTGVGKTELAKALSEALTGDEKTLIQLDMSEYAEKHALSRLIGPPPGYVGFGEPGQLTEPVRRRPASVILLDEIEKAHPDIFNLFLQVLEDGHLTDSSGRSVDFSNTTLIFTTNLGVTAARTSGFAASGSMGELSSRQARIGATTSALKEHFRPEFLNRIDHSIVFDPLTFDDILVITSFMVKRVTDVLALRDITLKLSPEALSHLANKGFDPEFGARPLRRSVQRNLEDRLSEDLLLGVINDGDEVLIGFSEGSLTLETYKEPSVI